MTKNDVLNAANALSDKYDDLDNILDPNHSGIKLGKVKDAWQAIFNAVTDLYKAAESLDE
jgi:hypothetical protein